MKQAGEKTELGETLKVSVLELEVGMTSVDEGHDHKAFAFINNNRISGWTSVDKDHFHVFDLPTNELGQMPLETTPGMGPTGQVHIHRVADELRQG